MKSSARHDPLREDVPARLVLFRVAPKGPSALSFSGGT